MDALWVVGIGFVDSNWERSVELPLTSDTNGTIVRYLPKMHKNDKSSQSVTEVKGARRLPQRRL
jgi:hypothetical protein